MEEKLKEIINHYGVIPQLKHFQSEVFELTEAIIDYKYVEVYKDSPAEKYHKNHIAEEIADVLVMVYQFLEYYEINQVEVCKTMDYKIERQLERIKKENENN